MPKPSEATLVLKRWITFSHYNIDHVVFCHLCSNVLSSIEQFEENPVKPFRYEAGVGPQAAPVDDTFWEMRQKMQIYLNVFFSIESLGVNDETTKKGFYLSDAGNGNFFLKENE
jgi:hypothetical protein